MNKIYYYSRAYALYADKKTLQIRRKISVYCQNALFFYLLFIVYIILQSRNICYLR